MRIPMILAVLIILPAATQAEVINLGTCDGATVPTSTPRTEAARTAPFTPQPKEEATDSKPTPPQARNVEAGTAAKRDEVAK